jgi:enoyl-CoA hydratase/carnithine racemase
VYREEDDMTDMITRKEGRAGRITFNRPAALNALSHAMATTIEAALEDWRDDDAVDLILIDAVGERAFCAGGDIAAVYHAGRAGDFDTGTAFWADEYRLNAKIAEYPKPIVAFMHGFVMGGGVGVGGHASLRIVGESSQIAMPECGIGLIPDVGGTLILARAPGRVGEYLGVTGTRIGAGDAIFAGFADVFLPEAEWEAAKATMVKTGRAEITATPALPSALEAAQTEIDQYFQGDIFDIHAALKPVQTPMMQAAFEAIERNSPLSMAATLRLIAMTRSSNEIRAALENEFRFTARAAQYSDFLEGVRAQIIDKDRVPKWRHSLNTLPSDEVEALIAPLPDGQSIRFS